MAKTMKETTKKTPRKILLWAAGIIAVLAMYSLLFAASKDSVNQDAAIAAIKKSYAPTAKFLAMHPDFIAEQWTAVKYPQKLDGYDDAYEVILYIDMIPDDKREMIRAEWLIYAGNTKYIADNMDAQTLFALR